EIGEEGDKKKARQRRRAREENLPPPYVLPVSAPPPPSETQAAGQSPTAESRNGSEEEKEEKPKLYPDLSTLPTPMRENKRTDNVSQPANIASSRNVSSPLAASFDYWLRSQREKGDAHQMPMLTFPNPQPRPTGEEEYVHWDPEVLVYRPWQPDELKEIAGELPDPQKTGGEKWVIAMQQLLTMYNPTLQEVEAVSRRCFKLRWANIRPANWSTSPVIGSVRFHDMMTSLADAVRAAFPLRVCWPEIHNTKQKEGELAADYRTRMESVFAAHSGIDAQNEAYDDLLKTALINGLHPSLKDRVMATCVGWETGTIANVWTHVLHA
ncbi:hypothetical protein JOB18_008882, partial [Solea senegalensis]